MKVITKMSSQKGEFPNYFKPLITAGLPLKKHALASLAKSQTFFDSIIIISKNIRSRCNYSKENFWIKYYSINNFKVRN